MVNDERNGRNPELERSMSSDPLDELDQTQQRLDEFCEKINEENDRLDKIHQKSASEDDEQTLRERIGKAIRQYLKGESDGKGS